MLKLALERLLGAPCYHMADVVGRPEHVDFWRRAGDGETDDRGYAFDGYVAAVDRPMVSFWEEVAATYPEAIILHSTRNDAETWFRSATNTIFEQRERDPGDPREVMWRAVSRRFFDAPQPAHDEAIAADERHNQHVIDTAPPERLVSDQPGDGWEPLCHALDLPVPDEPFPHTNTTAQFRDHARRRATS